MAIWVDPPLLVHPLAALVAALVRALSSLPSSAAHGPQTTLTRPVTSMPMAPDGRWGAMTDAGSVNGWDNDV
jgi:hypothetical protein